MDARDRALETMDRLAQEDQEFKAKQEAYLQSNLLYGKRLEVILAEAKKRQEDNPKDWALTMLVGLIEGMSFTEARRAREPKGGCACVCGECE